MFSKSWSSILNHRGNFLQLADNFHTNRTYCSSSKNIYRLRRVTATGAASVKVLSLMASHFWAAFKRYRLCLRVFVLSPSRTTLILKQKGHVFSFIETPVSLRQFVPERLEAWRKVTLQKDDRYGMTVLLASAKRGDAETFAAVVKEIASVSTRREVISLATALYFASGSVSCRLHQLPTLLYSGPRGVQSTV